MSNNPIKKTRGVEATVCAWFTSDPENSHNFWPENEPLKHHPHFIWDHLFTWKFEQKLSKIARVPIPFWLIGISLVWTFFGFPINKVVWPVSALITKKGSFLWLNGWSTRHPLGCRAGKPALTEGAVPVRCCATLKVWFYSPKKGWSSIHFHRDL